MRQLSFQATLTRTKALSHGQNLPESSLGIRRGASSSCQIGKAFSGLCRYGAVSYNYAFQADSIGFLPAPTSPYLYQPHTGCICVQSSHLSASHITTLGLSN